MREWKGSFQFARQAMVCDGTGCGKAKRRIWKDSTCYAWNRKTATTPLSPERAGQFKLVVRTEDLDVDTRDTLTSAVCEGIGQECKNKTTCTVEHSKAFSASGALISLWFFHFFWGLSV